MVKIDLKIIKFHYHPHSGTQRNWGLKLQVRVTDDRGALQRNKQGSLTTQNLQCFNLFFQKQPGLAPLYVFHNFFFVETKISCEQFHFLYLRKCADTCNAIIQGDMFQTSRELQMLSGSSSLLMALLRLIDFFWPIVIILTRVQKSQNQDSRVTRLDDHDSVLCRWLHCIGIKIVTYCCLHILHVSLRSKKYKNSSFFIDNDHAISV